MENKDNKQPIDWEKISEGDCVALEAENGHLFIDKVERIGEYIGLKTAFCSGYQFSEDNKNAYLYKK